MPGVRVKDNEPIESAIRRFKKQCEKAGILSEVRKREHYEKPSIKRKKKAIAARKRALKKQRDAALASHDHSALKSLRRQIHSLNHDIRSHTVED